MTDKEAQTALDQIRAACAVLRRSLAQLEEAADALTAEQVAQIVNELRRVTDVPAR